LTSLSVVSAVIFRPRAQVTVGSRSMLATVTSTCARRSTSMIVAVSMSSTPLAIGTRARMGSGAAGKGG
jgi:hypothetical protein